MLINGLPAHPILVHLPVALATLMPLLAPLAAWAWAKGRITRDVWAVVAGLQLLMVGSGLAAMRSGEAEEDRVERIVAEHEIEEHEEKAEAFVWAAAGVAVLASAAWAIKGGAWPQRLALAASVGTFVVLALAIRAGHAGGELVYKHGAGQAYLSPDGNNGKQGAEKAGESDDDD